ncbi:MAG TPA: LysR substrate-binding domain-containing protein [Spirochaetia bacterium]|nr:LysR substrate-binding domain-containing protein [Spirochaetia bacterium]
MELRYLRYFLAVAEEMNFSRAAKRLHISQPPLSRQIQALERELGTRLIDREGSRFRLTEAGLLFQEGAGRILDEVAGLERRTRLAGDEGAKLVRIGFVGSMMLSLLPELLAHLTELLPETRLDLVELATEAQVQAVLAGRIDLGFLRSWVDTEGICFEPLGEEPFSILCPEALVPAESSSLAAFAGLPFVGAARAAAPGLGDRIRETCAAAGFQPELRYECSQLSSVIQLVSAGLGWTIVPAFSIRRMAIEGVRVLPLPEHAALGVAYRVGPLPERVRAVVEESKRYIARSLAG